MACVVPENTAEPHQLPGSMNVLAQLSHGTSALSRGLLPKAVLHVLGLK
jgi:hypothetical protein